MLHVPHVHVGPQWGAHRAVAAARDGEAAERRERVEAEQRRGGARGRGEGRDQARG